MPRPARIRAVEQLGGFRVRLEFTDGTIKEIDLQLYLHGPSLEPMRNDPQMFRSVKEESHVDSP